MMSVVARDGREMRWSTLKSRVEERFAPEVQGRVAVHVTHYRRMHDAEGRWWVTLDGREVGGMPCLVADAEESERNQAIVERTGLAPAAARPLAQAELAAIAHHNVYAFQESLEQWLNLSVAGALASGDAVHRALALLDRRLGRRRLEREIATPQADRAPLELACLALRMEVMGMAEGRS